MNFFELRQRLIEDHVEEYTRGYLNMADHRIRGFGDEHLADGLLLPLRRLTAPGTPLRRRLGADSGDNICGVKGGRSV